MHWSHFFLLTLGIFVFVAVATLIIGAAIIWVVGGTEAFVVLGAALWGGR